MRWWWLSLPGLLLATTVLAAEGEPAPAPPATPAAEARALLESIDADRGKLVDLRREAAGAEGEERELLDRQVQDEELRVGGEVHDLATIVVGTEGDDQDLAAIRPRVVELMGGLPAAVTAVLDRRQESLRQRQAERDAAPADQALAAEQKVTVASKAVDDALRYYTRQVGLMAELGLPVDKSRDDLVKRLSARADRLAARIGLTRDEQLTVDKVLRDAPDDATSRQRAAVLAERLQSSVANLNVAVEQLKALGVDTTNYQKLLLTATGDVGAVGFDLAVLSVLAKEWLEQAWDWVVANAPRLLARVLVIALILVATWVLARAAERLARRALASTRADVSQLLQKILVSMTGNLIKALGVLVAVSQLGISVGPMLAGLGIAGFIVGFALQDTLSNFASGVMILFYRPFDVGDFVEAAGISGKVSAMNLVSTTILTFDNQTLIVPNNKIWGDVIRNVTRQTERRVDLSFGVSYQDDLDQVERILQAVVADDSRVLAEPAPVIRLHELGDSSVNYIVRPWVKTADYWDVYWDLTREVKRRFDAEGVSIPFPQRDVHHYYPQGRGSEARDESAGAPAAPGGSSA